MGRITSNVGLVTGLDIQGTVDQLMQINSIPRNNLFNRTEDLRSEQLAISSLTTRLLGVQFDLNKLSGASVFEARQVDSSDPSTLSATLASGAKPPVGSFSVRAVQTASSQQLISQRFEADDVDLGTGSISFGIGGFVNESVSLDRLRSGAGFERGEIRVTDRSGQSAVIDLSYARTVEDVLAAINENTTVSVTADTSGDSFTLEDTSGGSGNLIVEEVGTGATAASLGLATINVASDTATGSDVFDLYADTRLADLNDGNGVRIVEGLEDFTITTADESTVSVDLSGAKTVGDVIDIINAAEPTGKITAAITGGDRLQITDGTSGAGAFAVVTTTGSAADDLGLTTSESGGVITGERIVGGLRDSLLGSLNGGDGFGTLGSIDIDDRNGATDTVDLSSAETLEDVVDLINASSTAIQARINTNRSGIEIVATAGSGNLTITDSDANNTATALGIVVDSAVASVDGGPLNRQTLSEATLLSSLNGGEGVTLGDIRLTNSLGEVLAVDLNTAGSEATTVGDVIDRLNNLNGVVAAINDTGDGILITDSAGGSGNLAVADISGNVAESLNLTRASVENTGPGTQTIDGTGRSTVSLDDLSASTGDILLSSLNDGLGVLNGDIRITDSAGNVIAFDLDGADSGISTLDDLIQLINDAPGDTITARINDSGDGLFIEDTAGGSGTLKVEDVNGTTAANLNLTGSVAVINGNQTLNGAGLFAAGSATKNEIEQLADRINELNAGVTASIILDNGGYRLALNVEQTGDGNELLLALGDSTLAFQEVSSASDAVIVYGDTGVAGSGLLLSSSDNDFEEVISGVDFTINAASDSIVTVSVTETDTEFVDAVQDFVESYNALRDELAELTVFDQEALTTGLLFGTNEALRVDTDLSRALTDRYFGLGEIESLEELGLSLDGEGRLTLDTSQLKSAFAEDTEGVQRFFTESTLGFVDKFNAEIDRLAGAENSLLVSSTDALQFTIDSNEQQIEALDASLERQRERLLLEFFQLETLIASLQQNLSALESLQPIPPLSIQRSTQ